MERREEEGDKYGSSDDATEYDGQGKRHLKPSFGRSACCVGVIALSAMLFLVWLYTTSPTTSLAP